MSEIAAVIVDADGLAFDATLTPGPTAEQTTLRLADGAQFLVPTELLVQRADGRYNLGLRLRDYAEQTDLETAPSSAAAMTFGASAEMPGEAARETKDTVIKLVEETLKVGKRTVTRGRVELRKYVTERNETASIPLARERVEVERVAINQPVEKAEAVRYEGDTMIVPRYEEVLVVSKQLMLVEEVRITTQRSESESAQQVTLRREEIDIRRLEGELESDA